MMITRESLEKNEKFYEGVHKILKSIQDKDKNKDKKIYYSMQKNILKAQILLLAEDNEYVIDYIKKNIIEKKLVKPVMDFLKNNKSISKGLNTNEKFWNDYRALMMVLIVEGFNQENALKALNARIVISTLHGVIKVRNKRLKSTQNLRLSYWQKIQSLAGNKKLMEIYDSELKKIEKNIPIFDSSRFSSAFLAALVVFHFSILTDFLINYHNVDNVLKLLNGVEDYLVYRTLYAVLSGVFFGLGHKLLDIPTSAASSASINSYKEMRDKFKEIASVPIDVLQYLPKVIIEEPAIEPGSELTNEVDRIDRENEMERQALLEREKADEDERKRLVSLEKKRIQTERRNAQKQEIVLQQIEIDKKTENQTKKDLEAEKILAEIQKQNEEYQRKQSARYSKFNNKNSHANDIDDDELSAVSAVATISDMSWCIDKTLYVSVDNAKYNLDINLLSDVEDLDADETKNNEHKTAASNVNDLEIKRGHIYQIGGKDSKLFAFFKPNKRSAKSKKENAHDVYEKYPQLHEGPIQTVKANNGWCREKRTNTIKFKHIGDNVRLMPKRVIEGENGASLLVMHKYASKSLTNG